MKLAELRAMTEEELVTLHDKLAQNVVKVPQMCLDELNRRAQQRHEASMDRDARSMRWLTRGLLVLSIVVAIDAVFGIVIAIRMLCSMS